MLQAFIIMGGLGIVIGVGLAVASKVFYVYVDPLVEAIDEALPGANCGGCGYPGCSANAEAIVAGKAEPTSCVAGGAELAEQIAQLMGVAVEAREPDIARPGCTYGTQDADLKYIYNGMSDCRAAALMSGGMKICSIGCLGLGSCERACPFNAITMGPDGLPVVNETLCTGCGTCERVCPKHIITLSSITRRILKEYTTDECTTPCQRECPAGINICEYIRQISLGNYHTSIQVIKERLPFPTIIGRICPRPCETNCRRGLVDEPVAINYLKRFVADYEKEKGLRIQPYKAPPTGKKIAVIGGGVEGLSTAYFSVRLGHDATVFEATERLGGLLNQAISRYRLSPEILEWDIEGVLELGVKAETGRKLGKDFTLSSLLEQGYDSIFLATGGWDSRLARTRKPDVEEVIPGTYLLIDFIMADTGGSNKIFCEDDVVIMGRGKVAFEGAIIANDLGSKNITVLFRESRKECQISEAEVEEVEKAGIKVIFNAAVDKLYGEDDKLTGVRYIKDQDKNNAETIPARNLFIDAGRLPELIIVRSESGEMTEEGMQLGSGPVKWESDLPYKKPFNQGEAGMFAEGDEITDYGAVVKAIGGGRRAAASIHQIMYDIPVFMPENVVKSDSQVQHVDEVEDVPVVSRTIMPVSGPLEMEETGILEKGFDEGMAHNEAKRCLQCGLICYEKTNGS